MKTLAVLALSLFVPGMVELWPGLSESLRDVESAVRSCVVQPLHQEPSSELAAAPAGKAAPAADCKESTAAPAPSALELKAARCNSIGSAASAPGAAAQRHTCAGTGRGGALGRPFLLGSRPGQWLNARISVDL